MPPSVSRRPPLAGAVLEQTAKSAIDTGGKGMKVQLQGGSGKSGEMSTTYDDMEARAEMVTASTRWIPAAFGVGEAYVTWHDQYFKVKTFHAFPESESKKLPQLEVRVNHRGVAALAVGREEGGDASPHRGKIGSAVR